MTDKIKIANATKNLKTILTNLINTLSTLKVVDPFVGLLPIDDTTSTSLIAITAELEQLLS